MTAAAVAPGSLFAELAGAGSDRFPLLAERLAIDATNALRTADSGLRGLRGRVFLRRLWDGVTGRGQELHAAIGEDLRVVERATLGIVREVMREEARTQYCVQRVLHNLHAVNDDLDAATARLDRIETDLDRARRQLLARIRAESRKLGAQLEGVRREVRRDAWVRRLGELHRAGELHPGAGELVGAGLFLASVGYHYWDAGPRRRDEELRVAAAIAGERLASAPLPLEDAMLRAASEVSMEAAEPLLYLAEERSPHLTVLRALTERRVAGLATGEENAVEAIAMARATVDPDGRLGGALIRPLELAQSIARELLPQDEDSHEESDAWRPAPTFTRSR